MAECETENEDSIPVDAGMDFESWLGTFVSQDATVGYGKDRRRCPLATWLNETAAGGAAEGAMVSSFVLRAPNGEQRNPTPTEGEFIDLVDMRQSSRTSARITVAMAKRLWAQAQRNTARNAHAGEDYDT